MDISVIDKLPEGRLPIKNCVVDISYRNTAYKFIVSEINKGHQAYIICPAIEPQSDEDGVKLESSNSMENVSEYEKKLKKILPVNTKIGVLHGRMKDIEKDLVMERFKTHEIDVLISTTVVEVGVDVPNATVIMIENAERFGLAELHQLRGRVGRGESQAYCIMINTSDDPAAAERLGILNSSNDGFMIAEEDLRLRGPGDIFGFRQSGEADYRLADIYADADILSEAKEAVDMLMDKDPDLEETEDLKLGRMLEKYLRTGRIL